MADLASDDSSSNAQLGDKNAVLLTLETLII